MQPKVLPTVIEEFVDLTTPEPRACKLADRPLKLESLSPTSVRRQRGSTVRGSGHTSSSKAVNLAPPTIRYMRVANKLEPVVPACEEKHKIEAIEMEPGAEVRVGLMTLRRRRGTAVSSYKEPSLRSKLRRED